MVIYDIREVLRTSVEKKLKADITDAGTMLDGTGADFAFELNGRRYDVQIKDITKPKATTSKEWVKGYNKWKNEGVHGQQEQEELNASYKQSLANKKEREKK